MLMVPPIPHCFTACSKASVSSTPFALTVQVLLSLSRDEKEPARVPTARAIGIRDWDQIMVRSAVKSWGANACQTIPQELASSIRQIEPEPVAYGPVGDH